MYKITCTYDADTTPKWIGQYSDALDAFNEFAKFVDWGFADEYATINLLMPTGKMYTKVFYRNGMVVTK